MQRAVVIGAGFGGLAAAVRLCARGYGVTLLEANEQPGGRAAVFRRDGFTFDAGPTVITAPYLLDELFALVGRDARDYFTLVPVDPFYRVRFDDGTTFDYVGDEDRLLANIAAISPRDVAGYRRFAAHARRIFDVGYTQLADAPFSRLRDMLRAVPQMRRLGNWQTVWQMVARYIKDDRLRQVFTFEPLLVGGNPFRCSSIYALIHWVEREWGVHYAMGGTGSIIAALWKLLGELGADLHLDAPVERIAVGDDGRVRSVHTADGREFAADVVVCNADPSVVYSTMIAGARRRTWTDRRVRWVKPSPGLFVAYFGTRRQYPQLAHHTIVLGPRYRGLLDDIYRRRVLADDCSLYLHAPTRTDATMAPRGHECFYVLSPVPDQRSGIDWEQMQQPYLDRVLARLEATVLPGLRENLVTSFAVDPRYFAGKLRSAHGAAFGPEPTLTQSAWFRYHNVSEDVRGLFFVGAGTHPGAGVPGVLNSARLLERVLPATIET
ncbi:MAG: phytoene desaturase family protein [Planctomycetota bacterium]